MEGVAVGAGGSVFVAVGCAVGCGVAVEMNVAVSVGIVVAVGMKVDVLVGDAVEVRTTTVTVAPGMGVYVEMLGTHST
jgi:hypothetical protein